MISEKQRWFIDNYGGRISHKMSEFDKLLNCEELSEIFPPRRNTRNDQQCLSPSLEEIKYQIQNSKNHKSPREDEIVAELIKNREEELIQRN